MLIQMGMKMFNFVPRQGRTVVGGQSGMCEQPLLNADQLICKRTIVAAEPMNACIYTDPLQPPVREVAICSRRPILYFRM